MNRKTIILVLFAVLASPKLLAQYSATEYQKHEFSVGAIAGLLSLDHNLSEGKNKNKFSGGVGFGYTYFFKKNIGLATGVDFAFYSSDITLDEFSGSHNAFDLDLQKDFDFRYTLNNYKETQNAFYLNIPIMLHYQFTDGENVKFYGAGGVKVGLPISGKYKSSGANLKAWGYYPHDNSILDTQRFRGFGNFVTQEYDSEIKYKVAFNLAIEGGAKWTLPNEIALYTGFFLDYGLNDVNESTKGDLQLVQYNQISPENHIFNGMAQSSYKGANGETERLVSKINTMAYGIKIRLAFGK